ncbi:hypothetical protein SGFS_096190 [Streptomyces graminofaciens]|uniref:Fumarylacetoacetase-like C-terminal domain-containing protein n=1 Tax=Streptomyces graminofaciens TaxID=68212 RepID=A0ABN5VYI9_9ACTN|nr:hypothetical protein SGFS_096190 [Streptomyces graminofaciens]
MTMLFGKFADVLLVLTGTPGGVGAARDPKVFLKPGQVVRTVVEGIGECVNTGVEDKP